MAEEEDWQMDEPSAQVIQAFKQMAPYLDSTLKLTPNQVPQSGQNMQIRRGTTNPHNTRNCKPWCLP